MLLMLIGSNNNTMMKTKVKKSKSKIVIGKMSIANCQFRIGEGKHAAHCKGILKNNHELHCA